MWQCLVNPLQLDNGSPGSKRRRADVSLTDGVEVRDSSLAKHVITGKLEKLREEVTNGLTSKESLLGAIEDLMGQVRLLLFECDEVTTETEMRKPQTVSVGIQTSSPKDLKREEETMEIRLKISESMEVEKIKEVASRWWPRAAFSCTKRIQRSVANDDGLRVVLLDVTDEGSKSIIKEFTAQLPSVQRLIDKNPTPGQIVIAESSDTAILEGDEGGRHVGSVRKTIFGFVKKNGRTEEQIIEILKKDKI